MKCFLSSLHFITTFQHELYIRAFNILNSYEPIKTREDEINYSRKLKELLEDHQVSQPDAPCSAKGDTLKNPT